jgi:creatinine amidohydrolase
MILLNGHGGNNFNWLLREMYGQTQMFLTWVDGWNTAKQAHEAIFEQPGEHADEMETSWMLHLRPDLVFMEECDDGAVKTPRLSALREGWAWYVRPWERLTQNSGFGDPRPATAEKGEKFLNAGAERLAQFIKELSDAQMDETFPY